MKLDATPETVRLTAEVLKLASLLDDRVAKPDQARIAAWSEQIERHKFIRDDLMNGLQNFYDAPHDRAISIGDLIHHARIEKRNRLDKEDDADREARWAQVPAADMSAISAASFGPIAKGRTTPRLEAAHKGLQTCRGRKECGPAVAEYLAALAEARGKKKSKKKAA